MSKCFLIEKRPTYHSMKLCGPMSVESVRDLEKEIQQLTTAPILPLIVNCEGITDLSPAWLRLLARVAKELRSCNSVLKLAHVSPLLQEVLVTEGLSSSLRSSPTVHQALLELGLATPRQMDVNFINPFLIATAHVLQVQASTQALAGKPVLKTAGSQLFGDISGVIGLVSDAFVGTVVITFPESTFLKIMSRMLGEEFKELTPEIRDGASELTNIIFGQTKLLLNEKGFGIRTAIPSVVTGKSHSIQTLSQGGPRVAVPFKTDIGDFEIEICLSG